MLPSWKVVQESEGGTKHDFKLDFALSLIHIYTRHSAQAELSRVFDAQYQLTLREEIQIRTYTDEDLSLIHISEHGAPRPETDAQSHRAQADKPCHNERFIEVVQKLFADRHTH